MNRAKATNWMYRNAWRHIDAKTGECNATALVEECAATFEANDVGGPLDDETHWIWDAAVIVARYAEANARA
jgi:hypothetical protein